ncbi:TIGR00730 family Rossman fold protein [Acinetobacter qingfengensis]|uniref:Cytokinin riboside 5'-monophosphate phosphoribohydrolase n=1 Tax=Acinetobacter qingfengensis TaxID=1262585 RepID=A0A1E7R2V2_9GAMM|nr:TIGR00730 family Rossman fold protein [Acinetobacter qingfengensis]KAA8733841.1 TIGR00730 family Rossman fold protein [Acinetobacter qingfengensis]OEY93646.1 Rossman fold protein, TIGR00730 family [Acinetobacter qingfengensis]
MKAIAIFCGSATGTDPIFLQSAQHVGEILAKNNLSLVYGGGKVGLMGAVADSVLAHGGRAIGVMPRALVDREIAHTGLSELYVVENMHQRKMQMSELADGFIALPGGAGTLEEIYEQWTWAQLGIHEKPCAFLNINAYYQPLLDMVQLMVDKGFTQPRYAEMLIQSDNIADILTAFKHYRAPQAKWTNANVKP